MFCTQLFIIHRDRMQWPVKTKSDLILNLIKGVNTVIIYLSPFVNTILPLHIVYHFWCFIPMICRMKPSSGVFFLSLLWEALVDAISLSSLIRGNQPPITLNSFNTTLKSTFYSISISGFQILIIFQHAMMTAVLTKATFCSDHEVTIDLLTK